MFRGAALILCLFFTLIGCAGEPGRGTTPIGSPRFDAFRSEVLQSAASQGLESPQVVVRNFPSGGPNQMRTLAMAARSIWGSGHTVSISSNFLAGAGSRSLAFVANHEVCHIKLGHTIGIRLDDAYRDQNEREANSCACRQLGKDACIEALKEFAEGWNFLHLQYKSREEIASYIATNFGVR